MTKTVNADIGRKLLTHSCLTGVTVKLLSGHVSIVQAVPQVGAVGTGSSFYARVQPAGSPIGGLRLRSPPHAYCIHGHTTQLHTEPWQR
jgi:hypothetical protein